MKTVTVTPGPLLQCYAPGPDGVTLVFAKPLRPREARYLAIQLLREADRAEDEEAAEINAAFFAALDAGEKFVDHKTPLDDRQADLIVTDATQVAREVFAEMRKGDRLARRPK
jgi:hypothetical protein